MTFREITAMRTLLVALIQIKTRLPGNQNKANQLALIKLVKVTIASGLIIRVRVVPGRTIVGDIHQRFDNL